MLKILFQTCSSCSLLILYFSSFTTYTKTLEIALPFILSCPISNSSKHTQNTITSDHLPPGLSHHLSNHCNSPLTVLPAASPPHPFNLNFHRSQSDPVTSAQNPLMAAHLRVKAKALGMTYKVLCESPPSSFDFISYQLLLVHSSHTGFPIVPGIVHTSAGCLFQPQGLCTPPLPAISPPTPHPSTPDLLPLSLRLQFRPGLGQWGFLWPTKAIFPPPAHTSISSACFMFSLTLSIWHTVCICLLVCFPPINVLILLWILSFWWFYPPVPGKMPTQCRCSLGVFF